MDEAPRNRKQVEMTAFDKELLKVLSDNSRNNQDSFFEKAINLLDSLNFSEEEYLKCVDVLLENNNARKFLAIRQDFKKDFLLNKINHNL